MKLLSRKLSEVLLGDCSKLTGGTPLVANISYPILKNGEQILKKIGWEGNKGMIVTMYERIEKLEKELENKEEIMNELKNELKSSNHKLEERVVKIEKKVLRQTGDKIPISLVE